LVGGAKIFSVSDARFTIVGATRNYDIILPLLFGCAELLDEMVLIDDDILDYVDGADGCHVWTSNGYVDKIANEVNGILALLLNLDVSLSLS
jgi:hypothetical protein